VCEREGEREREREREREAWGAIIPMSTYITTPHMKLCFT